MLSMVFEDFRSESPETNVPARERPCLEHMRWRWFTCIPSCCTCSKLGLLSATVQTFRSWYASGMETMLI